jgi:hypothetical protein
MLLLKLSATDARSSLGSSTTRIMPCYSHNLLRMPGTDHVSRTREHNNQSTSTITDFRIVLITKQAPDVLVVSRGSQGNLDTAAAQASTGRAIVKVFQISSLTGSAVQYA